MPSVKNTAVVAVLATANAVAAQSSWFQERDVEALEEYLAARDPKFGMGMVKGAFKGARKMFGGGRHGRGGGMGGAAAQAAMGGAAGGDAQPDQGQAQRRSFDDEDDLYVRDFEEDDLYVRDFEDDLYARDYDDLVENYLTAREALEELLYVRAATTKTAAAKAPAAKPLSAAQKQTAGNAEIKKGAKEVDAGKKAAGIAKADNKASSAEAKKGAAALSASKQESATAKTELKDGRKNLAAQLNKDAAKDLASSRADNKIAKADAAKGRAESKIAAADTKGGNAKIGAGVKELESGLAGGKKARRDLDLDIELLEYLFM